MTQRLRELGVAGEFVEFFGPGVATLSAGERSRRRQHGAGVRRVAPATSRSTRARSTTCAAPGATRRRSASSRPTRGAPACGSIRRPTPRYTKHDRDRPRDRRHERRRPAAAAGPPALLGDRRGAARAPRPARDAVPGRHRRDHELHQHLRSRRCSSPPGCSRARRAMPASAVPDGVKTSLAPGSPAAARYLARAGLDADLAALGFQIVGYGCTTCIGNSGPAAGPAARAPGASASRCSRATATSRAASIRTSTSPSSCRRRW